MLSDSQVVASAPIGTPPRVVFVTRYHPYPQRAGAFIYTAQMIDLWAALASKVDVFCAKQAGTDYYSELHQYANVAFHFAQSRKTTALQYLFGGEPKSASDFSISANRVRLSRLFADAQPDIIVLDHIGSTWCLPVVLSYKAKTLPSVRLIYTTHNEETSTRLSIASGAGWLRGLPHIFDAGRIRNRDKQVSHAADAITCITRQDGQVFFRRFGRAAIVLPPIYGGNIVSARKIAASGPRKVVLVSSFLWSAKLLNLRLFLNAATAIEDDDIEIHVIGRMRKPDRDFFSRKYPKINFHGEVDNVERYLSDARIGLLIDQAGGGFKLTSLTYAFNRVPIASLRGALAEPSWLESCLHRDSLRELAQEVFNNIDDIEYLNSLQEGMFRLVESYTNNERNRRRLYELVGDVFIERERSCQR